jgi:hypothetical protein
MGQRILKAFRSNEYRKKMMIEEEAVNFKN